MKPETVKKLRGLANYIKKLAESDDFNLNEIDEDIARLTRLVLRHVKTK